MKGSAQICTVEHEALPHRYRLMMPTFDSAK